MPNYQNGKIYKIWSLQTDKIYIGSTTDTLSRRLAGHKQDFKRDCSCYSKDILKYGDAKIELIETFPCNIKEELYAREGHHIRLNKDFIINHNIAGRTDKEYFKERYQNNKEKIKNKSKVYYENNKINILEKSKEKYQEKKLLNQ